MAVVSLTRKLNEAVGFNYLNLDHSTQKEDYLTCIWHKVMFMV